MKTTNNVQKTANRKTSAIKSVVLLTAMAGLSLMAGAHENTRSQAVEEKNEFFTVYTAPVPAALNDFVEMPSQTTMEVETWMISENLFTFPATGMEAFSEVDSETALEVESWMVSETYFVPVSETEDVFGVEEWMLQDQNFIGNTPVEESDRALEVETWMMNPCIWGC